MAILLGTQSNGETLPVQVNELGQLVAKGIDGEKGEPGNPGAPGVGQLPPDPYEGAILGWEDGALAWVGGSVSLPSGIFGPFTYVDGTLNVDNSSALVNGQQIYMSDIAGNRSYYTPQSSPIVSVTQASISLEGRETEEEEGRGTYEKYGSINDVFGQNGDDKLSIDGWWSIIQKDNSGPSTYKEIRWVLDKPYAGTRVIEIYSKGNAGGAKGLVISDDHTFTSKDNEWTPLNPGFTYFGLRASQGGNTGEDCGGIGGIRFADTKERITNPADAGLSGEFWLTFSDSTDLRYFQIGMEVQPGITIVEMDLSRNRIEVSGGTWSTGGQTMSGTLISGDGSVELEGNGFVVLRDDNKEWVDGFYVTAPEQLIAARKLVPDVLKNMKK